jgi:outer membrane scaffolding protein for murein synthesis (MipA/OmpV family)
MKFFAHRVLAPLLATIACVPLVQAADEKPLWEAGLGVATVSFPAYRGSDQTASFVLPSPYFVYRGEFLKADRNGFRGQLFDSEYVDLTLSAALSPPAFSDKIRARAGMPDLKTNVEFGPQVDISLWKGTRHGSELRLLLPLRAAFTLEGQPQNLGWVAHPKLNLDLGDLAALPGWNVGLQLGTLFGDRRQHNYFYGVDPAFATATRPAYAAGGGYAGMQALMGVSKRFRTWWVGGFVRYDNLSGARFLDSPLVRTRHYFAGGVAVSWILGQSATRVLVDE